LAKLGPAEDLEDDMLDLGVSDRRKGSRLSCQIPVSQQLDGLVVEIPPSQS
jgi:2Fe-2S ferredoxin